MEQELKSAQAAVQEQGSQLQAASTREAHLEQQVTALTGGTLHSYCHLHLMIHRDYHQQHKLQHCLYALALSSSIRTNKERSTP